ncbi:MAG: ribonuclease HI [Proteobacteria bacterium]|nr:ribonuclease HI [Pseudomonadota bacterium]
MAKSQVQIFTDGSCLNNPGPGGWAALMRYKKQEKMFSGSKLDTTNNQMELQAVISGLTALTKSCEVELYTDSRYVIDGFTQWLAGWKAKGWKRAKNKPLSNKELWQKLDKIGHKHSIQWHWIKGHSGHPENERVDQLARSKAEEIRDIHQGDA